MNLQIEPLSIKLSKRSGYGISILGYGWNDTHRAIGFNIYKFKYPDRTDWMVSIFIYGIIRRYVLKSNRFDHFIHIECGNPVWKHNLYCQTCEEELYDDEVRWVNLINK